MLHLNNISDISNKSFIITQTLIYNSFKFLLDNKYVNFVIKFALILLVVEQDHIFKIKWP